MKMKCAIIQRGTAATMGASSCIFTISPVMLLTAYMRKQYVMPKTIEPSVDGVVDVHPPLVSNLGLVHHCVALYLSLLSGLASFRRCHDLHLEESSNN